jgi:predicted acetyltransferase
METDGIEIHTVEGDMARKMIGATGVAFSFDADEGEIGRILESLEPGRFIAPVDDGAPVGSAGQWSYEVTMPGGARVRTGGVTFVTVLPTHRRRGILTRMMRWLLDDARSREEPLSALWASEATIYGRFGYGQAVAAHDYTLDSRRAEWRLDPASGSGRLVEVDVARPILAGIHEQACARHGMFARSDHLWDHYELVDEAWMRQGGYTKRRIVVWQGPAGAEGYALFRTKESGDGAPGAVKVTELHAVTQDAYRGLMRFMAAIDLTDSVIFQTRATDEPLPWLLADSRAVTTKPGEYVWFRVVDVPVVLTARTYGLDGAITIGVHDGFDPGATGTWRLEVDGGAARCTRVTEDADVAMDAAELGAIVMGGRSALPLAAAGRIVGDAAQVRRLDLMFRTQTPPWSAEHF